MLDQLMCPFFFWVLGGRAVHDLDVGRIDLRESDYLLNITSQCYVSSSFTQATSYINYTTVHMTPCAWFAWINNRFQIELVFSVCCVYVCVRGREHTQQTKPCSPFHPVIDSIHVVRHQPTPPIQSSPHLNQKASKGHHHRELPCSRSADALKPHLKGNVSSVFGETLRL